MNDQVQQIIARTSRFFNVSEEDILGESRVRPLPLARHVAMYVLVRYCDMTLEAVGHVFGRHHSSVIHGRERVEAEKEFEPQVRAAVQAISTGTGWVNGPMQSENWAPTSVWNQKNFGEPTRNEAMAVEFICDGCGKRQAGYANRQGQFFKPHQWYQRTDDQGTQIACSRECVDNVAKVTKVTRIIIPGT